MMRLLVAAILSFAFFLPAFSQDNDVFWEVDKSPEFPDGQEELFKFISNEVKYPPKASEDGVSGVVYVQFIIDTTGKVTDVEVLKGIGAGCDLESIRMVKSMPHWTPGEHEGKKVNVGFRLPIRFTLKPEKNVPDSISPATFPGGDKALEEYLATNLQFPDLAKKHKIEGVVQVKFKVTEEGKIVDVGIWRGIGAGCDTEAYRLVTEMPDWKPYLVNGVPQEKETSVSIPFKLPEE